MGECIMKKELLKFSKRMDLFEKLGDYLLPEFFGFQELKTALLLMIVGGRYTIRPPKREGINIILLGNATYAKNKILKALGQLTYNSKKIQNPNSLMNLDISPNDFLLVEDIQNMHMDNQMFLAQLMKNTTLSVLASNYPKFMKHDYDEKTTKQYQIHPNLLNQFDFGWTLQDILDEERDTFFAEKYLKQDEDRGNTPNYYESPNFKFLRKYLDQAKSTSYPVLQHNSEAAEQIMKHYCKLRSKGKKQDQNQILNSIIRFSEASAKIRLSTEITDEDTKQAINLVDLSLTEIKHNANNLRKCMLNKTKEKYELKEVSVQ